MTKRTLLEWGMRIFLVFISLVVSLLIIEFVLQKCIRKTIRGKVNPEPYEFTVDVNGFRTNIRHKEYSKASGEYFRIICLGDSFTFGHGVSNDETYPYLLGEYLNKNFEKKVQIMNAGVCGATIDGELKMYADNCADFEHQLVILLYQSGDMNDLFEKGQGPDIIDVIHRNAGENMRKTKTLQLLAYEHDKWKGKAIDKKVEEMKRSKSPAWGPVYDKYFEYLKDLDKKVRLHNSRLAVVFYEPEDKIMGFCRSNGISFIDITEEYGKQRKAENLFLVYHHNKHGNGFLAQQIGDRLINEGYLDRN